MRDCEDCGDTIPEVRLAVKPDALLCISCQHLAERQGRFQRHQMSHLIQFAKGGEEIESVDGVIVNGGLKE